MMARDDRLLSASGLECVRGERRIFSGISFSLGGGTLLEVRGPNGSGKSSLLRILCGLLSPSAGEISWNGRPIAALAEDYRAGLAYVGHQNGIKDELTAKENLTLAARLAGLPHDSGAIGSALRGFGLTDFDDLPCRVLSQGQRRRVSLSRLALSGARPLWVLDEPLAALDAGSAAHARTLIDAHLIAGGIVVLTTHDEATLPAPAVQRLELRA